MEWTFEEVTKKVEEVLNNQKYRTKLMNDIVVAYIRYKNHRDDEDKQFKVMVLVRKYWDKQEVLKGLRDAERVIKETTCNDKDIIEYFDNKIKNK